MPRPLLCCLPFAALVLLATAAEAQVITARAVVAEIHDQLLGGMRGVAFAGHLPLGSGWLGVDLAGERLMARYDRSNARCNSLPIPDACSPSALNDHASATALSLGVTVPAVRANQFTVRATAGLALSSLHFTDHGLTAAPESSSNKTMWRADIGIESGWRPSRSSEIGVTIGGTLGWLAPFNSKIAADGSDFGSTGSRMVRAWIGLSWFTGGGCSLASREGSQTGQRVSS